MPSRPFWVSPGHACSWQAIPESTSPHSAARPVRAPSGDSGISSQPELELALGAATIAVFPYRAELDQSGALLQALGAGVPAVVYDVGGLGEIVGAFGAGRVVPGGDVPALRDAIRTLLHDADELAEARAGATQACDALTWENAADAHLDLYGEVV